MFWKADERKGYSEKNETNFLKPMVQSIAAWTDLLAVRNIVYRSLSVGWYNKWNLSGLSLPINFRPSSYPIICTVSANEMLFHFHRQFYIFELHGKRWWIMWMRSSSWLIEMNVHWAEVRLEKRRKNNYNYLRENEKMISSCAIFNWTERRTRKVEI